MGIQASAARIASDAQISLSDAQLVRRLSWLTVDPRFARDLPLRANEARTEWLRNYARYCWHEDSLDRMRHAEVMDLTLHVIDALLDTHGVEHLRNPRTGEAVVLFANSGDAYNPTVYYHRSHDRWSWADLEWVCDTYRL